MTGKELLYHASTHELDYIYLTNLFKGFARPRQEISRLLKSGHLIRVKKGLCVLGAPLLREPYSKERLANVIYGPSYVSLDYALAFYGLVPERAEVVTSVTSNRDKEFRTPIGVFVYRYLHAVKYALGVTQVELAKERFCLMATPEKALIDKVYFCNEKRDDIDMRSYLFDDLRIDAEEFAKLNLMQMKTIAAAYREKNIRRLVTLLEGMKGHDCE